MIYRINIMYKDAKSVRVDLHEDEYQQFIECFKNKEVYWGRGEKQGFFTDCEQVRYVQIFKVGEHNETLPTMEKISEENLEINQISE